MKLSHGQTFCSAPELAQAQPVIIGCYAVQKDFNFGTGELIKLVVQVFSDLLHRAAYQSLKHGVPGDSDFMAGKVLDSCIKEVARIQPGTANLHKVVVKGIEMLVLIPFVVTREFQYFYVDSNFLFLRGCEWSEPLAARQLFTDQR